MSDIGIKSAEVKRKTEKLSAGMYEAQDRVMPLWSNPSHTRKERNEKNVLIISYCIFIIFYAILSNLNIPIRRDHFD